MKQIIRSDAASKLCRNITDGYGDINRQLISVIKKIEEDYAAIREYLNDKSHMGIIQPLRAIVVTNRYHDDHVLDTAVAAVALTQGTDADFYKQSRHVGYLIAVKDHLAENGGFRIGMSFCRPADYRSFDKRIGICLAFNSLHLDLTHEEQKPIVSKTMRKYARRYITTSSENVTYFFNGPLQRQFNAFEERCRAYYA